MFLFYTTFFWDLPKTSTSSLHRLKQEICVAPHRLTSVVTSVVCLGQDHSTPPTPPRLSFVPFEIQRTIRQKNAALQSER